MTTYRMNDGLELSVESPKELLEKLWAKSFTPSNSLEEFCEELGDRIEAQTGYYTANRDPLALLEAMLHTGLAVEVIQDVGEE